MLNRRPIFINAFARGGSNIITNLILSHPDVCISSGETHKVFKGTKWDPLLQRLQKRLFFDLPIRLVARQDIFDPQLLENRKAIPGFLQRYIDRILYEGRFSAMIDTHNRYRTEGVPYTRQELAQCRLLSKGLGGLVFTVDLFREMYPDATFLALTRNGLALCEGHVRRGTGAERFAGHYRAVAGKMLELSAEMDNYHILSYEDMVGDPLQFMRRIYELAGLDIGKVEKVRLQSKKVMAKDGTRSRQRGDADRQVFWDDLDKLPTQIRSDVNRNQIEQLSARDREAFLAIAGDVMGRLGYA